jgi:glycosyltransferase involved in cell wall biosynthesis
MSLESGVPKVTILIPSYRHEKYIHAAITSVLIQTFTDFELIVIDDASPDKSWDVIQGFDDPRIRTFRHEANRGAVATLNEGLRLARGQYISILNSDDIYHPSRLETLVALVEASKAEFVFTDIELMEQEDQVMRGKSHGWIMWFEELKNICRGSGDAVVALLAGNLVATTSNMFFPANLPARIGYFYDYRYAHDYEFVLRYVASQNPSLLFLDNQKLLTYRLHSSNTICESKLLVGEEVRELLLRWLSEFAPLSDRYRVSLMANQIIGIGRELQSYSQELDRENIRLRHESEQIREECRQLRMSHSFRLGSALLTPGRGLYRWMAGRLRPGG